MMGDTMDEAMEGENDEEEEAEIVSKILDEIGIDAASLVPDAPNFSPLGNKTPAAAAEEPSPMPQVPMGADGGGGGSGAAVDPAVSELEERLNNLRRN